MVILLIFTDDDVDINVRWTIDSDCVHVWSLIVSLSINAEFPLAEIFVVAIENWSSRQFDKLILFGDAADVIVVDGDDDTVVVADVCNKFICEFDSKFDNNDCCCDCDDVVVVVVANCDCWG